MNYNEFKDYVKEHVLDYLPEQYKNANMDIRQAVKNNDVVLDGLTIFNPNGNMSPTIYLNSAYEEYQQGMDIEEVVGKIADAYIEHIEPREEYRFNFDLQEVKKKIWQLPIISGRMEMRNPWGRLQSTMI